VGSGYQKLSGITNVSQCWWGGITNAAQRGISKIEWHYKCITMLVDHKARDGITNAAQRGKKIGGFRMSKIERHYKCRPALTGRSALGNCKIPLQNLSFV